MTMVAPLVERARRMVLGSQREKINMLAADIDEDDTTLVLQYDTADITPGQYLSIGFEVMVVTANVIGAHLTVMRGADGSTAMPVVAGTPVICRPVFTDWDFFCSMQEELADLSSPANGLYQVLAVDISPVTRGNLTDLTRLPNATSVVKARLFDAGGDWLKVSARLERGMDCTRFPSGVGVRFDDYYGYYTTRPVRVWVRAPFDELTVDRDVEETGLSTQASDLLSIGAAFRMIVGREHARSLFEIQGDTRRANEVPMGAERQGLTPIAVLRKARIEAEKARLDAVWVD